jgi:hypothetical protein
MLIPFTSSDITMRNPAFGELEVNEFDCLPRC